MKNLHVKNVLFASIIVYILGVSAFVSSYYLPLLSDPDLQANLVLGIAIIPAAMLGARFYYRKGIQTNGLLLGACMFLIAMLLDALITVPVFIIPAGGDHITFFTDPGFWVIALVYLLSVTVYWRIALTGVPKDRLLN